MLTAFAASYWIFSICLLHGHAVQHAAKEELGDVEIPNNSRKPSKVLRGSGHGRIDVSRMSSSGKASSNASNIEGAAAGEDRSLGCGKAPLQDGYYELLHNGLTRKFLLQLPKDYNPNSARSLIVGFHGFGTPPSFVTDPAGLNLGSLSHLPLGPIIVAPEGMSAPGLPAAFNGGGSSESPGTDGETCHPGTVQYSCHSTCLGSCQRCWWTSCADDVGFTLAILDFVKAALCVDSKKVYATGFSGGAQFTFELASNLRSASHFEAVAILSGLPHNGFLRFPGLTFGQSASNVIPRLLGVWAGMDVKKQDPQCPPLSNVPGRPDKSMDWTYGENGGYYYSSADNTTMFWARNICGDPPNTDVAANQAAIHAISHNSDQLCTAWCSGQVIKCLWQADQHIVMPNTPFLVWHFFQGAGDFAAGVSQQQYRRSAAR